MDFLSYENKDVQHIVKLFKETFTASEGATEGDVIASFVTDMFKTTPKEDLYAFVSKSDDQLTSAVLFSRFKFEDNDTIAFILSPMAVHPKHQKQGIGQKLIRYALETLEEKGTSVAITYGDPAFYSKVGFKQVSENDIQAPLKLSHPHGWLAQYLGNSDVPKISGKTSCVHALNNPELW